MGNIFRLTALGSEGRAECFVQYAAERDLEVNVENTLPDFHITRVKSMNGQVLIVNITIMIKAKV